MKIAFMPENLPRWRDLYMQVAAIQASLEGGALGAALADSTARLTNADLWWVRKPMVRLAVEAAQTLNQYTTVYAEHRPAECGIIAWQGGTGIMSGDGEVTAAVWLHTPGVEVLALPQVRHSRSMLKSVERGVPGGASLEQINHDTARLVATTWLLATSPGITNAHQVTERGERVTDQGKPGSIEGAASGPGDDAPTRVIKIAYLREPAPTTTSRTPTPDTAAWHPSHAHVVRGHWRNQAHGPGRALRRPTWIHTHVRGPGDTAPDLPLVRIWRR